MSSLRIPRGTGGIEHIVRHPTELPVCRTPDIDRRETLGIVTHAEGQIVAARRPGVVTNLTVRVIGNFNHLAIGERDDIDLAILVAKGDAFAVRGPLRLITHGTAATRDLF